MASHHLNHDTLGSTSPSLLLRVQQHDHVAWQRLVRVYGPLIRSWCVHAKLQDADLDDVLQDVLRAVAQNVDRFRLDENRGSFRGWLRTITQNKIRDHFRRRAGRPPALGGSTAMNQLQSVAAEDAEVEINANPKAEQEVYGRILALMRDEFTESSWRAFYRTAVDGQTARQVAEELDMTPAAVRKAKSRVLHRIRSEFQGLLD